MSHECEHGMLRRVCLLCEMTEQRDELRAEVERLKADAERYQWMKRVHADGDESVTEWIGFYAADQWDEEIDRERLPFPTTAQRNEE